MQKSFFISCIALIFFCGCVQEKETETLNILFTGEASGELEPCGCTGMKTGGVAQRSGWIRHLRNRGGKWVLIDGGFASKKNGRQQKIKFTTYRDMLKAMEYDFACVTQKEATLAKVPQPYIGNFKGKKFAILRLETTEDYQEAQTFLEKFAVDLVIVMAKGKTSSQVYKGFPQGDFWRVFLINDAQNPITPFTPQEKTVVLSAGDRGRYAGVLQFSWQQGTLNWQHEHIAITSEYGAQQKITTILENYKRTVKEARLLDFEMKRSTPVGYVGTDMCKSCHTKEYRSWLTKQDHSHAFATLQKQNYHHDPECVKCHVVGYEFAEGYRNWEESDYLINVGCESCHGPGASHAFNPKPGYGRTAGEEACTTCHDKDHSPTFQYREYREKIRHWHEDEQEIYMLKFVVALFLAVIITAQDDLVISPETISLGKIPDNKKIDMVFTVKNDSNSTVVIEKVETSCGCSSAYPTPAEVLPAGISKIKANLDPRGKKGYSSWQIKVFTNSVNTPILYASFDADVLQTGTVSHKFLSFGEFRRETTQQKRLWISPQDNPDFKIINIEQNIFDQEYACFDIEVKDDVYAGFHPGKRPAKCIVLTTKKDIPYGRIDGELTVETNIPGYEKIKVAILARVAGDIGVRPDTISFGLLRNDKPKTRHAFIYHRNGESFAIKAIHSPWKEISVTKEEMIEGQYYKIIVVCTPSSNMKAGEMRDHIVVETSDEKQTQIKIPLQGFVMK